VVPPNIILVIGDDHGYPDFGFMGSSLADTPTLDGLAESGFVFTHGYAAASTCRASLAAILTGLYPIQWTAHRLELAGDGRVADLAKPRVMQTVDTLPRLLAEHGYASFQSGKYWEGHPPAAGFDEGMGFDRTIGRETLDPIFDFIDGHRQQPFFVWYAPMLPHIPHDAPAEFTEPYADRGLDPRLRRYLANIAWFDAGVAKLVEGLETRGLREQTLIVYLADNGWQAVGERPKYGGVMRAFLGGSRGKGSLYELGYRTPMIFHWPGQVPAGRSDALVSAIDLLPTLVEFAGGSAPAHRPGKNLRPVIESSLDAVRERLIGSREAGRGGYFLRDPRWRYLKFRGEPAELYDVLNDPEESRNLAARHPAVNRRSEASIRRWVREVLAQRIGEYPIPPP
jgi:uncharacterized sulfatase